MKKEKKVSADGSSSEEEKPKKDIKLDINKSKDKNKEEQKSEENEDKYPAPTRGVDSDNFSENEKVNIQNDDQLLIELKNKTRTINEIIYFLEDNKNDINVSKGLYDLKQTINQFKKNTIHTKILIDFVFQL